LEYKKFLLLKTIQSIALTFFASPKKVTKKGA